jgi:hypothetical protein
MNNSNKKNTGVAGRPQKVVVVQAGQGKSRGARRRRAAVGGMMGSEYETVPVSIGMRRTNRGPRIGGNGTVVRVQHREYVGDISGSVGYLVRQFAVNPGQSTTFPWLSIIARNFEKYRFRRLRFLYESSTSTVATGVVLIAIDLDASDPAPPTKQAIMAYEGSSRSNVWQESGAVLPEMQPELYVRPEINPINTDIKTYDAGNFWFATQGCADISPIGELYVEYDVDLHVPQLALVNSTKVVAGLSTTVSFLTSTFTGSAPYIVLDATSIAVLAPVGTQILVMSAATNSVAAAAPPFSAPTVFGSSGVVHGSEVAVGSIGVNVSNFVFRCVTTTDATFTAGPGWFILAVATNSGIPSRFAFSIQQYETGIALP